MPTDYPFDAVLLQFSGDTNAIIARQRFRTVNGVPLSPTWWTTKDAEDNPLAVYEAEVIEDPNRRDGDETVYYRALSYQRLYGPGGAPTLNQHHDATPYEETKYTAVLAPEDGETKEFWFANLPTTNGLIPEHITVLAVSRTTVYLYKRSHLVAPDRAVFTRYGHDLLNGPLPHDQEDQYDVVLRG